MSRARCPLSPSPCRHRHRNRWRLGRLRRQAQGPLRNPRSARMRRPASPPLSWQCQSLMLRRRSWLSCACGTECLHLLRTECPSWRNRTSSQPRQFPRLMRGALQSLMRPRPHYWQQYSRSWGGCHCQRCLTGLSLAWQRGESWWVGSKTSWSQRWKAGPAAIALHERGVEQKPGGVLRLQQILVPASGVWIEGGYDAGLRRPAQGELARGAPVQRLQWCGRTGGSPAGLLVFPEAAHFGGPGALWTYPWMTGHTF
mmetsp:Transcript_17525/g.50131  ORF Transcript_17525/g.50131 Transcript_17525/m.50131 type:complete len:256 (-) Transcript_17525:951-1718(-)